MKGNNAIVGQSGGPTAAINSSLAGVVSGILENKSSGRADIGKIFGMRNGIEGFLNEEIIEIGSRLSSEEDIKILCQTPASALGSCRKQLPTPEEDDGIYRRIFDILEKFNIGYFFYIGGNDSMDTCDKLSRYAAENCHDVTFIGIPKTIDNDLYGTDHAPGYGSAAKYIAVTMSEIVRDCAIYKTPAVTIVEVMGRGTGWLAAAAGLPTVISGEGPDYIYFPERTFDYDNFLADIKAALTRHPNVVIAVSEGLKTADGKYISESTTSSASDAFGHKFLSGTAKTLESFVKAQIGCKVRAIELNLPQRCGAHIASECDISESFDAGRTAVEFALTGKTGVMVSILRNNGEGYGVHFGETKLSSVANAVVMLPDDFINTEGNNATKKCLEYLFPLIQGERQIVYRDGLPLHFVF